MRLGFYETKHNKNMMQKVLILFAPKTTALKTNKDKKV